MSRPKVDAAARTRVVAGVVLVAIFIGCLINAVVAVDFTRRLDGPQPGDLEERYGDFRQELEGVAWVAYISSERWRYLNARYVLAPTILDPRFVTLDLDARAIVGFDLEGLSGHNVANPPLLVLCDFEGERALEAFVRDLSDEIEERELRPRVIRHRNGVALLSVGG